MYGCENLVIQGVSLRDYYHTQKFDSIAFSLLQQNVIYNFFLLNQPLDRHLLKVCIFFLFHWHYKALTNVFIYRHYI